MGRGIGKTQLAILTHLSRKGKPLTVADIAWYIWDSVETNVGDTVPRSLIESVRRGAKSLERLGKVKTGYKNLRGYKKEVAFLVVWLPEMEVQYLSDRVDGAVVESAILASLKQWGRSSRLELSYSARVRVSQAYPRFTHSWRQYPAIHRAIKKLVANGKIRREVVYTGSRWKEYFISVDL